MKKKVYSIVFKMDDWIKFNELFAQSYFNNRPELLRYLINLAYENKSFFQKYCEARKPKILFYCSKKNCYVTTNICYMCQKLSGG